MQPIKTTWHRADSCQLMTTRTTRKSKHVWKEHANTSIICGFALVPKRERWRSTSHSPITIYEILLQLQSSSSTPFMKPFRISLPNLSKWKGHRRSQFLWMRSKVSPLLCEFNDYTANLINNIYLFHDRLQGHNPQNDPHQLVTAGNNKQNRRVPQNSVSATGLLSWNEQVRVGQNPMQHEDTQRGRHLQLSRWI